MIDEYCPERPLFGGAINSKFPQRLQDLSNIRQVPDHQETFVDPTRDESLIFELLEFKRDVDDNGSATHFLIDLATEQAAGGVLVTEQSELSQLDLLGYGDSPVVITTAVGQMDISKGHQGREAQNRVRVYLANLRLKDVATDVLITAYEPIYVNPLSDSASTVGCGLAVPASHLGLMSMDEIFKLAVSTFKINDPTLFDSPYA